MFDIISVDFPWNFKVWNKDTGHGRSAEAHYRTITWDTWKVFIQWIWPLMARDCALCLWMVRPSQNIAMRHVDILWNMWIALETRHATSDGVRRISDMGFPLPRPMNEITYKTELFTLVKKYRSGKPSINGGYYTRANTEPCYLWVRGDMSRQDAGVPQVIDYVPHDLYPKEKRHSYKPPEYRRRIERLWPGKRYLEIFARENANEPGWTYVGNEIDGRDFRDALPMLQ